MTTPTTAAGRGDAHQSIIDLFARCLPDEDLIDEAFAAEKAEARAAALDEARRAVANLYALRAPENADEPSFQRQALAAIDALRERS